jgi:hypothetical protein
MTSVNVEEMHLEELFLTLCVAINNVHRFISRYYFSWGWERGANDGMPDQAALNLFCAIFTFRLHENFWTKLDSGRGWADSEIFPKLFYIIIVITDACDLFQIQCVNIHWLHSFDNVLLFTHNKCNCFLVIQGFSIRRFCFLRFCYRYIYYSVLKHSC